MHHPNADGLGDLHERLAALEKQNRRFKQFVTVGLVGITLLLTIGQAPAKKTIEANEFVLRDDGGNIRARLFVTAKRTSTMNIPGSDKPVPVTLNPKATLALYDEEKKNR